ncbi:PAS domain-containing protein [Brevundimonas sp.]|uniref:PAS domain-containing protein n=1 Tax=Brevundimonas sp. TaxID=1871086 RepID=UPI001992C58C|nr:PAS domain-containing protein [Brevundimonas sp.]MBD3837877.1 PAS domain-containing protein [Brevundimonas sp.]
MVGETSQGEPLQAWLDNALQLLLSGSFPTFVLLTEERRVMFNAACHGTVLPSSARQGEPLAQVSPALAEGLNGDLDRALAGETPTPRSIVLDRPEGRDDARRFTVSSAPLRRGRTVIGVICRCQEEASAVMAEHARSEAEARVQALQARIDRLADLSPSLLLRLDPCGQIRWMNGECQRYVGQTLAESRRDGWLDWIHPSEREAVMREWGRSTAAQTPFDHRHRLRDAAGGYGWFQVRCLPQFDEARELVEWHAACLPLHEISPLAQAIAANADGRMVLWVADPADWTVHVLNPDPALGWPLGRASARVSWADHLGSLHEEDRAHLQAAFVTLAGGARVEHDYRAVTDRGDLLSVAEAAFPILDENGVVSRFVGLSRITAAVPSQVVVVDPTGERHARVAAAIRATGFQPEVVDSFKGVAPGARRRPAWCTAPAPPMRTCRRRPGPPRSTWGACLWSYWATPTPRRMRSSRSPGRVSKTSCPTMRTSPALRRPSRSSPKTCAKTVRRLYQVAILGIAWSV